MKEITNYEPNSNNIKIKGAKDHNCELCGKNFKHLNFLKRHIDAIHAGHKCETCGKTYTSKYLKKHIKTSHKKTKCEICEKEFCNLGYLKIHIKSIHGVKEYKCEICSKEFVQFGHLKLHVKNNHEGRGQRIFL